MNSFQRKIALRVLGIHVGIILFFLIVAGLKGCFQVKPKPEIITYIEFGSPAPPVNVQPVEKMTEPEPPAPAPEPEPPAPVPEPVKKTIPKPTPKKTVPKPEPKKPEPKPDPKPKWKPTDPSKIKIGKKVNETPSKPAVSSKEIEKALSGISSSAKPTSGPVGNPSEIGAYDALLQSVYMNAWVQPGASGARPAQVTISLTADGRIKSARITRSSGDSQFDATVQAAVNKVNILPRKPPAGYPLENNIVNFSIVD